MEHGIQSIWLCLLQFQLWVLIKSIEKQLRNDDWLMTIGKFTWFKHQLEGLYLLITFK